MGEQNIILEIRASEEWHFDAFVIDLANGRPVSFVGCNVYQVTDIFSHFRERIEHDIVQNGLSNLLRRQLLTEAVVSPDDKPDYIRDLLVKFLSAMGVDGELIIVDPYFFAPCKDPTYPDFVCQIICPFVSVLRRISVISLPNKVDSSVKQSITQRIEALGTGITLNHNTSPDYHDRFWISSSRSKGILTGSSLNGLGRKYAIVDKLAENDVRDIVNSLIQDGLI